MAVKKRMTKAQLTAHHAKVKNAIHRINVKIDGIAGKIAALEAKRKDLEHDRGYLKERRSNIEQALKTYEMNKIASESVGKS